MKKIIMLLVDSLLSDILEQEIRHRTVPAFQFLMENGIYRRDCVTVFPTMTASVDSSLLTGVYPDRHRVPGLIWYDHEEKKIVNYLNGWKCVSKLGISNCMENVLYDLNEKHLSNRVKTLFEELAETGRTSASINAMIHRGIHRHKLNIPLLLKFVGRKFVSEKTISGPEVLSMGALVETADELSVFPSHFKNFRNKLGVNDAYASRAVRGLIESGQQPDFILAYFPDNDHEVHRIGPANGAAPLIKVDHHIQHILNAFSSWEEALQKNVFIVISDHGQTYIGDDVEFNIDLDVLLKDFRLLQLGEEPVDSHELVVCNNERMAYIYPLKRRIESKLMNALQHDARIDLISWKERGGVRVVQGGSGRQLFFRRGGSYEDIYGNHWDLAGDESVLDLVIKVGKIHFADYPDALSRLYGALYARDEEVFAITARPRYEFKSRYYPTHLNGGSHGSLHCYDSCIPLLIAGSDQPYPSPPRLVDMKQYILDHFHKKIFWI